MIRIWTKNISPNFILKEVLEILRQLLYLITIES